jgi:hypothetical protein
VAPGPLPQISWKGVEPPSRKVEPFVTPDRTPPQTQPSLLDRLPKPPVVPTINGTPSGTPIYGIRIGTPREPSRFHAVPPQSRAW